MCIRDSLYRFRDTASYWSKIANFLIPSAFIADCEVDDVGILSRSLMDSVGCHVIKPYLLGDRLCDGRTDGHVSTALVHGPG